MKANKEKQKIINFNEFTKFVTELNLKMHIFYAPTEIKQSNIVVIIVKLLLFMRCKNEKKNL